MIEVNTVTTKQIGYKFAIHCKHDVVGQTGTSIGPSKWQPKAASVWAEPTTLGPARCDGRVAWAREPDQVKSGPIWVRTENRRGYQQISSSMWHQSKNRLGHFCPARAYSEPKLIHPIESTVLNTREALHYCSHTELCTFSFLN